MRVRPDSFILLQHNYQRDFNIAESSGLFPQALINSLQGSLFVVSCRERDCLPEDHLACLPVHG